ncbi:MAG: apolipoprotein N-acyltransferase [Pseudanabaenaceae cyanobacterium SKYGB_i_bin29]|nr:apolipoprotein N-acyltransferase [Pseudanabaenaceae cyanobacterium SKYG29]MDW8421831.1 apolipoprotein N-acyltransferase [Pseudanabaenaceae cyanobacterium SKYGB_i_bin29]
MGLCPAPWDCWWGGWVSLAPLWWAVQGTKLRLALALGLLWGGCYHGLALLWLTGVHPLDWLGLPWLQSVAIACGIWLAVVVWGALLVGLWAMGMAGTIGLPLWLRLVVGVGLFCGLERLWSWSPLYWSALGFTQSPHNLLILQWGRWSGQQTITALLVFSNGLLAELLLNFSFRLTMGGAIFLLITIGYGWWQLQLPVVNEARGIRVGLIQGNVSNREKFSPQGVQLSLERYRQGYQSLARSGVDVIVTPEGALPGSEQGAYQAMADLLATYGVPLWLGVTGQQNSLILWGQDSSPLARFDKVKLVPLGEYVPQLLEGIAQRLSPLEGEFIPGASDQIVDTPWGRWIVGICYESAFPDHFRRQAHRGGQIILTASNNAHYAPAMPWQHHAQDVARAIETDRYAVRVTNTGYSAIVDPQGRTLWLSGLNTTATHIATVYPRSTQTLYVQWGDWLTPLLMMGATIGFYICGYKWS